MAWGTNRIPMCFLYQFLLCFPDADRDTLEKYFPYALIHHAYMELSLGRQHKGASEMIPLTGTKNQVRPLNLEETVTNN